MSPRGYHLRVWCLTAARQFSKLKVGVRFPVPAPESKVADGIEALDGGCRLMAGHLVVIQETSGFKSPQPSQT